MPAPTGNRPVRTGSQSRSSVLAVLVEVMLTGFLAMVHRMDQVPLRDMRMVPSALVIPSFVVVGCCSVMASSVIVVLRGLAMMLSGFF